MRQILPRPVGVGVGIGEGANVAVGSCLVYASTKASTDNLNGKNNLCVIVSQGAVLAGVSQSLVLVCHTRFTHYLILMKTPYSSDDIQDFK